MFGSAPIWSLATLVSVTSALTSQQLQHSSPALPLALFRHLESLEQSVSIPLASHDQQTVFSSDSLDTKPTYVAHTFDQLISHDPLVPAPSQNATFKQRYWFDATYYKPGGPVFLLDGGETNGEGRLPFLEHGILRILSEATGGIGVVFEHRYYGESFPVLNLTTDSYRFLTTAQHLSDTAHFASTISFPGLSDQKLTAEDTAWMYYGGSYAGAVSAFARKLYPEVWWGALASSAVTTAIIDFWEYHEPIKASAPPTCVSLLINNTRLIDSILSLKQPILTTSLKSYFGLPNITRDEDFVNALTLPLSSWQARNWDPEVGSDYFEEFCEYISSSDFGLSPETSEKPDNPLEHLLDDVAVVPSFPSLPSDPRKAFAQLGKYADFVKTEIASLCPAGMEQDECFGTSIYGGDSLKEAAWKSWSYQVCTEWGYFIGAPPEGTDSIVSKLLTVDYTSEICRKAFPDGEINKVPSMPNVTMINQYGSFELEHPRLAFIDGSEDPWLYATPHSPNAANPHRKDTIKKPFKLIPGGVHHWDENSLSSDSKQKEPKVIRKIHEQEVEFVKAWMKEWRGKGKWRMGDEWEDVMLAEDGI